MKHLFILLIQIPLFIGAIGQNKISYKLNTYKFDLKELNLTDTYAKGGLGGAMHAAVSGTVLFKHKNLEHIITTPGSLTFGVPIHFIKKNNTWEAIKYYKNVEMTGVRNYSFMNDSTIVFANTGFEGPLPWPFGNIYSAKINGDSLDWKKISTQVAYYHDVSTGDINNDGLKDVIGVRFGTYGDWLDNALNPHLQNKDGSYKEARELIERYYYKNGPFENQITDQFNNSGSSVLIEDIVGDSMPEIIKGEYHGMDGFWRYGFVIFKFNVDSNKYVRHYIPNSLGPSKFYGNGTTKIRAIDFDKDGDKDLFIAYEGDKPGNSIQIWVNDNKGNFTPGQLIEYSLDIMQFREFELLDVNGDSWDDIVLNPFHWGNKFRLNIGAPPYLQGNGFRLENCILLNKNGIFEELKESIVVDSLTSIDADYPQVKPGFFKAAFYDNQLKFIGFQEFSPFNNSSKFKLYEVTINFCNKVIKPIFNTNNFAFCSGDSLKLSVSNINRGDSIKWYFGTKSDLTNVSNKIFTDSTKLFVTRTDSVGCISTSDTILLIRTPKPAAPFLSRDSENNLVSNSSGNIWYKDGVKIADTTRKFKPTSNGIYAATTTQNGCTSALSQGYYYITNAVANLSNGEYIKISPNPTNSEVFFNYNIRSSKEIYISVVDISGRTVVSNRKIASGSIVNIGSVMKGNYIIQVRDESGRLISSQRLVKE